MKKIANSLFGAPNCRPFGEIGGLPIGPKWTNLKIFQSYIEQNPNWKGDSLKKKMPTLVFWAPYCGPFWTYWMGLPIGPELSNFKIFELFSTQNPNSKGVRFMKKIANSCTWGPILQAVFKNGGVCRSAQKGPIWKIFNFFSHKIRIKRGSVLWKKFPTHVFEAPTIFYTKSELQGGLFYEKIC